MFPLPDTLTQPHLRVFQEGLPVQIACQQQVTGQLTRSIVPLHKLVTPFTYSIINRSSRLGLTELTH